MSVVVVNDGNFKSEVLEADKPVLVDFWAPWCGPCNMVSPVVEEIANDYEGRLKTCKMNVDEAPATASQYGIMSIPTLMVFKGGKEVERIIGALPRPAIEGKITPHV